MWEPKGNKPHPPHPKFFRHCYIILEHDWSILILGTGWGSGWMTSWPCRPPPGRRRTDGRILNDIHSISWHAVHLSGVLSDPPLLHESHSVDRHVICQQEIGESALVLLADPVTRWNLESQIEFVCMLHLFLHLNPFKTTELPRIFFLNLFKYVIRFFYF